MTDDTRGPFELTTKALQGVLNMLTHPDFYTEKEKALQAALNRGRIHNNLWITEMTEQDIRTLWFLFESYLTTRPCGAATKLRNQLRFKSDVYRRIDDEARAEAVDGSA
jgi:hypothetical protein